MGFPSPDYVAGRITLIALRARLPAATRLVQDGVILEPTTSVVSTAEAVRVLAQYRKPIKCRGRAANDVLAVSCEPLNSDELRYWRFNREFWDERGGMFNRIDDRAL